MLILEVWLQMQDSWKQLERDIREDFFLFYIRKLEQTWAHLNVLIKKEQVEKEQLRLYWIWHTVDESIYKILSFLIKCKMSWWILNSFFYSLSPSPFFWDTLFEYPTQKYKTRIKFQQKTIILGDSYMSYISSNAIFCIFYLKVSKSQ